MAEVKAGVVTAAELQGGMQTGQKGKALDFKSPTTWSVIFVILAILFLFGL